MNMKNACIVNIQWPHQDNVYVQKHLNKIYDSKPQNIYLKFYSSSFYHAQKYTYTLKWQTNLVVCYITLEFEESPFVTKSKSGIVNIIKIVRIAFIVFMILEYYIQYLNTLLYRLLVTLRPLFIWKKSFLLIMYSCM